MGTLNELTNFTIWGKLKQNESRWIPNLFWHFLCCVLWTTFFPPRTNSDIMQCFTFVVDGCHSPFNLSKVFYLDGDEDEDEEEVNRRGKN